MLLPLFQTLVRATCSREDDFRDEKAGQSAKCWHSATADQTDVAGHERFSGYTYESRSAHQWGWTTRMRALYLGRKHACTFGSPLMIPRSTSRVYALHERDTMEEREHQAS
jgi:hypothetical protein